MAEIQIRQTTIIETGAEQSQVEMVLADQADIADATEYVTLKVTVSHPAEPLLAEVQLAALRRARDALGEQTHSFAPRIDRTR